MQNPGLAKDNHKVELAQLDTIPYTLISLLGKGGFGAAYLAIHNNSKERHVIKIEKNNPLNP